MSRQTQGRLQVMTRLLCGLAVSVSLSACAPLEADKKSVVKQCVLPSDQTGSLAGRWKAAPIPIAFHTGSGGFDSSEVADIVAAADSWNHFTNTSLGFKALDYGDATNPNQSSATKPGSPCSEGIMLGNEFVGKVVIYKTADWSSSRASAIAVTTQCPTLIIPAPTSTTSAKYSFYMALIELNYKDYFVSGKKQPDLVSIMTHEFGHLLGLHHSCESTQEDGRPMCNASGISQDYLSAVMYPNFSFYSDGFGEQRRTLNRNDQGRANCLYQDLSSK